MLVEFKVTNFLSFNEETVFSLKKGRATKKLDHLYNNEEQNLSVLKFATIYGQNGVGKSNFIKAVAVLKDIVKNSRFPLNATDGWCRVNDENENLPSFFEIKFIVNGKLYSYRLGVLFSIGKIIEESLSTYNGNRKKVLYVKEDLDSGFVFNKFFGDLRLNFQVLTETLDLEKQTFLNVINSNSSRLINQNESIQILKKVYNWFSETLEVIFPDQPISETSLLTEELITKDFASLLKEFATGIESIEEVEVTKEKVFENLDSQVQLKMNLDMQMAQVNYNLIKNKNIKPKKYSAVIRSRVNIFLIRQKDDGSFSFHTLLFVHNINGKKVKFSMARESDGTHRLFQLLEILVTSKKKVFIIDELNRSFHPNLTIKFIEKFFEKAVDHSIQLIISTHETRLMNHKYLRRDEIFITDFNEDHSTKIYNMEEKRIRIDKELEENYLTGIWGGIPKF